MNKNLHITLCSALTLFAACAFFSQTALWAQEQAPTSEFATPTAGLLPDAAPPAVVRQVACPFGQFFELSNGLSIFVQNVPGSPLGTVRAYVRQTGSQNEGGWLGTGISHLVEHLTCGGTTTTRSKSESTALVASLGGGSNAATGKEFTSYYIDVVSEKIPTALDLVSDWMRNIVFDPDEFASEKRVILQELLDAENNPGNVAAELLDLTLYREHPARHPIGGYPALLSALTLDDVKAFYSERYTPNNVFYYIAGDVDPASVVAQLAEAYRGVPKARETAPALPEEPAQIAPRESVREMDVERFILMLAWPTVKLSDPDLYPLDTLATILSAGESGRLNRRIKNQKMLGGAFAAYSDTPASAPGAFVITADASRSELESVQSAILEEIDQLIELAVPPEELAKAKKITEAAFVFHRERIADVADSNAMNYLFTGNADFDRDYLAGIRSVTADDLRRVARRYFNPTRLNRILIAPIGAAPKPVAADTESAPSAIEAFKLPGNGVRMFLKRSGALPKVTVQIYLLGGSLLETEKTAGRGALLAELLGKGSEKYSRAELEDYFASIGGTLTFSSGRNTLGAEMTVLKEDLPDAMDRLSDALLRPTFPPEELDRAKKGLLERIVRRSASPMAELFDLFSESLPASTPYHLPLDGKLETIEPVTADDLRALHQTILSPENMTIAIFGDIDPQQAGALAAERFGALPPNNAAAISFDRRNELLIAPDRHKQTNKGVGTGLIAWPTVSVRDEPDAAALTVLATVLGGYRYPGGRLFESLRADGLVYRLTVDQIIGPAPGYFFAAFESAPEKINEIFARIEAELERIKKEDLPESEIAAAKERIVSFHPMEFETDAARARKTALDDLYGLGYNNDTLFNERIRAVTAEDVYRVARKYFNQKATVSTSPNETR